MGRVGIGLALMAALAGCGGSASPSGSSPASVSGWPAGAVVELVSGETGAVVTGAQVVIGGLPASAGVPLGSAVAAGETVDVTATGFLPRRTLVRTGEMRLVLWPDTPAYPGAYTRALVYTDTQDGGGQASLRRLASRVRSVAVSPSAEVQADAAAMQAHREAAAALSTAGMTYVIGGAAEFTVPTRIDPGYSSCSQAGRRGSTLTWVAGAGEITRAEVVFCGMEYARSLGTVVHELGHTFGLRHSSDARDMMAATYRPSRATAPTGRETLTMALMLQRRPGTVWPDDDRTAQAAARRFEEVE
jgi:Matrixin